ncbi:hypothetical protein AgCh_021339 [Apium graveolens]
MADKKMTCLAKMNVARKSNEFPIRSRYTSLIDMINTRGDEYPSDAHLDAHDHISALRDPKELEKLSSCFKIKEPFKLVLAGPADRACQWKKDALCVYRDILRADRTTAKTSIEQTPYSLVYSTEVVLLVEVMMPTTRYGITICESNQQELAHDIDNIDEVREMLKIYG